MKNQKYKILHLAEAFGGGVYYFLRDLLNRPELNDFNFEILYGKRVDFNEEELKRDFPKAKLIYWPYSQREIHPYYDYKALREAFKTIKISNPDLIHCHSSKAGVLGRFSAFMGGRTKQVIYSPHGLSFLKLDDPKWKRKVYQYIEKICASLGGTVVGCSPSEARALINSKIRVKMIPSGTVIPETLPEKKIAKPFKVVTVGQIYIPKNPELFNQIAELMPEVEFVWVGDGNLRHLLTAKNIFITGWLPRQEISKYLNDSHVYLSTSLWEGLPLAVLEGMANGMPLLLKNCVGNVDLVNDKNGFLFQEKKEALNKLKGMLSNPEELTKMGTASYQFVRQSFSMEGMANQYRNLYLDLIANQ